MLSGAGTTTIRSRLPQIHGDDRNSRGQNATGSAYPLTQVTGTQHSDCILKAQVEGFDRWMVEEFGGEIRWSDLVEALVEGFRFGK
jgi:hypothetical protein